MKVVVASLFRFLEEFLVRATRDDSNVPPWTRGAVKKSREQMAWEGERPREPLWVRVFLTTGSRGRSPSLFFHSCRGREGD